MQTPALVSIHSEPSAREALLVAHFSSAPASVRQEAARAWIASLGVEGAALLRIR